jgi:peptidoglycan/xylan/chitin deacetylase (PgdA/CDA1 family)
MVKRLLLVFSIPFLFAAFSSSVDVHLLKLSFHPHPGRSCIAATKQFTIETSRLKREYIIAGEKQLRDTQKIAYLTFDDGPNRYTKQILNILKEKRAKATFFVIGSQLEKNKELIHRILDEGHYVGLHSMSHDPKKLYDGTPDHLIQEMKQAKDILYGITGFETHLIRVPYGSMPYLNQPYRDALVRSHFKMWDWTVDPSDWESNRNPSAIVQKIMRQTNERVEVILLHDKQATVKILPQVIDYLHAKGYTLLQYNPYHHIEMNFWKDTRL